MPSIPLTHPPQQENPSIPNPLPQILHTPSGLALIELQGSVLSSQTPLESEIAEAINLGRLVFPSSSSDETNEEGGGGEWDGKRVFLFVGKHQRMAGEVKKLGKAVAVVRRREETGSEGEEVVIEGIVRYKMIFAHRPEPMGAEQKIVGGGAAATTVGE